MTYPSPPRIHGNGFIQVDLDEVHRLHVWDHRIQRQRTDSSIHDHAFGFHSRTLMGTIVNVLLTEHHNTNWQVKLGYGWGQPTHNLYRVVREPDTAETSLKSMRRRAWFQPEATLVCGVGNGYHMPPRRFHISFHLGTTVTLIRKEATVTPIARVACRIGERPDNGWVRGEQEIPSWALRLIAEYNPWRLESSSCGRLRLRHVDTGRPFS